VVDSNGNENCMAGLQCPDCGNSEALRVVAMVVAKITDEGVEAVQDFSYDDDSLTICCRCDRKAFFRAFYKNESEVSDATA